MWHKSRAWAIIICCFISKLQAQELFPLNEPASSVPKNVVGIRAFTQQFKEVNQQNRDLSTIRSLYVLRVMYGLTSRLSVMTTGSFSNHHSKKLPPDLIYHTHVGNQTNYYTGNIQKGHHYPMLFNGVDLFAKFRFISRDKKNRHFRMSVYGEWSNVNQAHDEAEPNLMDDTGGYGGGLITTILQNRFAVSLTSGFIKPNSYYEKQPDLTGGLDLPTTLYYGDTWRYNLSFGYRISPKQYTNYQQQNWNVYLEFMGKSYQAARVVQNGVDIPPKTLALLAGHYVEVHPGVQGIFNSNLRIELSAGFRLVNYSYVHFTPMWTLAVQRYFFNRKKRNK